MRRDISPSMMSFVLAALATAAITPHAPAQPTPPTIYTWQSSPDGATVPSYMGSMIRVNVGDYVGYSPTACPPGTATTAPPGDPELMALATAKLVRQRLCEGRLTERTIAVPILGFGNTHMRTDLDGPALAKLQQLEFFQRSDMPAGDQLIGPDFAWPHSDTLSTICTNPPYNNCIFEHLQ